MGAAVALLLVAVDWLRLHREYVEDAAVIGKGGDERSHGRFLRSVFPVTRCLGRERSERSCQQEAVLRSGGLLRHAQSVQHRPAAAPETRRRRAVVQLRKLIAAHRPPAQAFVRRAVVRRREPCPGGPVRFGEATKRDVLRLAKAHSQLGSVALREALAPAQAVTACWLIRLASLIFGAVASVGEGLTQAARTAQVGCDRREIAEVKDRTNQRGRQLVANRAGWGSQRRFPVHSRGRDSRTALSGRRIYAYMSVAQQ
jgi:hypothetical protein